MNIKYAKRNDELTIYLYGEIDEYSAKGIRVKSDEIIENNCSVSAVTFDLSAVTFMDSTGIGMLLGRYKKLKSYQITVYITGVNSHLDKILELSGIYRLILKK